MSDKLKILYTALRYPPAPGGAEFMIQQIAEGIKQKGYTIKILATNLQFHGNRVELDKDIIKQDPDYITRYKTYQLPNIPYPISPMMDTAILTTNADLVHGTHFYYYPADTARFYTYFNRKPFIFTPFFYTDSRNAKKWQIYRKTLGALSMRADCILAITDFEKKLILKHYPKVKRIEVIKPGINQAEFAKPITKQNARKNLSNLIHHKLNNNNQIIMFAGRVCTGKGIDILIKAAPKIIQKYPKAIFLLVGSDFTNEVESFKTAIQKLGLTDKFIFTGSLNRSSLITAYFASDLFTLPSRYEAFGIVLAEAMAAGLPIVATNYSAIPEVVINQKTGILFEPENHQDLADKINKLLDNSSLYKQLSQTAKKEARQYDWQKTIDLTEQIYLQYVK